MTTTVAGTFPFMAPEALLEKYQSNDNADYKVDIWSAGILLFQLTAHQFPFKDPSLKEILTFMTNKKLQRPKSITDNDLWNLITLLLAFDPKDRLSATEALNHKFFTGKHALKEITKEVKDLALIYQQAQQQGVQNVTPYDTNTLFIVPLTEVRRILLVAQNLQSSSSQSQLQLSNQQSSINLSNSSKDIQQSSNLFKGVQTTFSLPKERFFTNNGYSRLLPTVISIDSFNQLNTPSTDLQITSVSSNTQNLSTSRSLTKQQSSLSVLSQPTPTIPNQIQSSRLQTSQQSSNTFKSPNSTPIPKQQQLSSEQQQTSSTPNQGQTPRQLSSQQQSPTSQKQSSSSIPKQKELSPEQQQQQSSTPFSSQVQQIINQYKDLKDSQTLETEKDLRKLAEILNIPLSGNEQQMNEIVKIQDNQCQKLYLKLQQTEGDEFRNCCIYAGIANSLQTIFEKRDLKYITKPFIVAFFQLTSQCSNELKLLIFSKQPYPHLLNLLSHSDNQIINYTLLTISNLLISGLNTTPSTSYHPHFQIISACDGINKLFSIFMKSDDKEIKDCSAICIGRLYRAQQIGDQSIKIAIISHLKSIINDPDVWTREASRDTLSELSQNISDMRLIVRQLRIQLVGSEIEQKKIIQKQENECEVLSIILRKRNEDELFKIVINSGIVEALLAILKDRELSLITSLFVSTYFQLTKSTDKTVVFLYSKKNPYPSLIRLLNHNDRYVLDYTVKSINNILIAGANTTPFSSPHPHFEVLQKNGDIDILFSFFKSNNNKKTKDSAAICIGEIFRNQEIKDQQVKRAIISHLKLLLKDPDEWTRGAARSALGSLVQNQGNTNEILNDDYLPSIQNDLKIKLEGSEQHKLEILSLQEKQTRALSEMLKNNQTDEFRRKVINAGIYDSLLLIILNREIELITEPYLDALFSLTISSDKIQQILLKKNPYPSLIRLFNHNDINVIQCAIKSIFNLLICGLNTTLSSTQHPHFEVMSTCGGINKLISLFNKTKDKDTKDRVAICVGRLYRAKEDNNELKKGIIPHIKSLINDQNQYISEQSRDSLSELFYNLSDMRLIARQFRIQLSGSEEQIETIVEKQEIECEVLSIILQKRKGDQIREIIINSGIVEALLAILKDRDFKLITTYFIQVIYQLSLSSNDLKLLLYSKKNPYPSLIRLLTHTDNDFIQTILITIYNLLIAGSNKMPISSPHPHFEAFDEDRGIEKLYSIFKRTDLDKEFKDNVAIIIAQVFKAKEIPNNKLMRTKIISHLKTLIDDPDDWTKQTSRIKLENLDQNSVNHEEIEKDGFKLSELA